MDPSEGIPVNCKSWIHRNETTSLSWEILTFSQASPKFVLRGMRERESSYDRRSINKGSGSIDELVGAWNIRHQLNRNAACFKRRNFQVCSLFLSIIVQRVFVEFVKLVENFPTLPSLPNPQCINLRQGDNFARKKVHTKSAKLTKLASTKRRKQNGEFVGLLLEMVPTLIVTIRAKIQFTI